MKVILLSLVIASLMVGCGEEVVDMPKLQDRNENGQKEDELTTYWYESGQKREESNIKDGKLMSAVVWKPNGEKCPVTNVKDGNGDYRYYRDDGTVEKSLKYKDGVIWLTRLIAARKSVNTAIPIKRGIFTIKPLSAAERREVAETGPLARLPDVLTTFGVNMSRLECRSDALFYLKNKETPFTGLAESFYENGQKRVELIFKDGKQNGLATSWYENGQKRSESNLKDGKHISNEVWKPNGEKCPVSNFENGKGVMVNYKEDGTEISRMTYP